MSRRAVLLSSAVVLVAVVLGGAVVAHARTGHTLAVEAYTEPGGPATARVSAAAPHVATIGIDGVTIAEDGRALNAPPEGIAALARTATRRGAATELLVSNYSSAIGDFSPRIGTALLGSAVNRERVAGDVARLAARTGMDGVQIDLESLRARDRPGLVAFAAAVRSAVHEQLGSEASVSMAVMASTDAAGFHDTGYDLRGLTEHVDRFVLMTYDQHGPWSGPGTVGALPWATTVVRAAERQGVRSSTVDLGVAGYGYGWGGDDADAQLTPSAAARAAGERARWSDRDGEWSARLDDGRVLHWSDARSYAARTALARQLGLHGVAMWSLNTMALPR
ncbi:hydrolase [Curtobacterium sp. VKM Ac-2865]|uniref:glycosyl hydrolase family 18 protein n=1 Tax=Curtobacterium sp. VKM Ac-2865 TaxID=2783817 RepID=UPI00188A9E2F|nr:glycosyl hydrolase family 18 protein [Curtobacterium sp. VKM Ac-2865]MBF4583401.1 hydrolase [Curtobacterium sp. VKM Ac-2865]